MRVLVLTILFTISGIIGVCAQSLPAKPPQPQPDQPVTPQATPPSNPVTGVPAVPGQNVGDAAGRLPADLPADPPPVAPNFEAPVRPLPSVERVGVDLANQMPLTVEEAIELALRNNNDIDT